MSNLGIKSVLLGLGFGTLKMSRLNQALSEFREFKNKSTVKGNLNTALGGIRKKVVILVPNTQSPVKRWRITLFLLKLAWSAKASGSVITGAFLSLLTIFAEHPAQMIRALSNDPDLEAQIVEVKDTNDDEPALATRGNRMDKEEQVYKEIAKAGPSGQGDSFPFARGKEDELVVKTTEDLQIAIASVTLQIWVLLTKAVTAPDNAPDAENRRWVKFLQQRRVDRDYQLSSGWLSFARETIAGDLSIRRFMVEILLEIRRSTGVKSRIIQMIEDVGNYIQEAGMAGFLLTIKYGIETRYPTLALNEFQGDLSTVLELMKAYKDFGERAPFMVILEESAQTKFAPGNFPLLWSYAMGVGSALDASVSNLNYMRSYLMMNYFRLGQDTVIKMEGNLDPLTASELGVTPEQAAAVRNVLSKEISAKAAGSMPNKSFVVSDLEVPEEDEDDDEKRFRENLERVIEAEKKKIREDEEREKAEMAIKARSPQKIQENRSGREGFRPIPTAVPRENQAQKDDFASKLGKLLPMSRKVKPEYDPTTAGENTQPPRPDTPAPGRRNFNITPGEGTPKSDLEVMNEQ
ncbi:N protein [Mount Mabu Lophuromys virus 1]|uniref:Nucleocapsid n=1 Tax=Mount Mabu Lophuromys virus 1 TaxID=2116559 RepID=A0A2P1GJ83_9MONO|nr:N protein [Mount Mabu Lophuromys virus 1]AVM86012.1 N protein [Mount Mabu Lophuromys virus 1]